MKFNKSFEFRAPTRIVFGNNVVEKLGMELKSRGAERIFLVTDNGVVHAGLLDRIMEVIEKSSIGCDVFEKVEANPSLKTVTQGAEMYRSRRYDGIVALGGGSPIDAAKAIGVKATHEGDVIDYTRLVGKPVRNITPLLIAIPTTSGTGSEVTWSSVLSDPDKKVKTSIKSPYLAPYLALIDPLLTRTMPPLVTAFTGMDALTHAVEAYLSIKATTISDTLALKAVELIGSNLRAAVGNGNNMEARANMMLASTLAGMAFSNSSVCLVHAVAHALGGQFNIAHGIANAIMLPPVMGYNLIENPAKFGDIAWAMGEKVEGLIEMEAARLAVQAVEALSVDIGIPKDLVGLGADPSRIDNLAQETMNQKGSCPFNPRTVKKTDVVDLFKKTFGIQ